MSRAARCAAAIIASLACLLGGCGFHLEGRYSLPASLAQVRIDAVDSQSDFYFGLRSALLSSGSKLTTDLKAPAAVIHILEDGSKASILAVSTLNVPTEYELVYTVRFSVIAPGGRTLIAPQTRTLVQDYSYSESEQLAKQREQQILTSALAREMTGVVMRQLSRL